MWVLGSPKVEALATLIGSLGFCSQYCDKIIVLLSILFKAIILIPLCHGWVKYGKPLNLMLHPLHLEIGLC